MEDQIPPSQPPIPQIPEGSISPAQLAEMKARAMEMAIQQGIQQGIQQQTVQTQQGPRVVYVRRNWTVAELLLLFAVACGIVTGIQQIWNYGANVLPRIEIRVK